MALLKDCEFAQHGETGGEDKVYDATAGITAPETTSQYSRIPTSLKAKRISERRQAASRSYRLRAEKAP